MDVPARADGNEGGGLRQPAGKAELLQGLRLELGTHPVASIHRAAEKQSSRRVGAPNLRRGLARASASAGSDRTVGRSATLAATGALWTATKSSARLALLPHFRPTHPGGPILRLATAPSRLVRGGPVARRPHRPSPAARCGHAPQNVREPTGKRNTRAASRTLAAFSGRGARGMRALSAQISRRRRAPWWSLTSGLPGST